MSALVLALNPCIDAEWRVDDVVWEEKNNVLSERRWAGGKGINVARWLKHLGGKPRLLLPLGGQTGRELRRYLRGERLPVEVIALREPTRVNIIVTTADGRQMRFNPLGPRLVQQEWRAVFDKARQALAQSSLLILSGSLARGISHTAYAQLVRCARAARRRTLLDCDGEALAAAAKAKPFLVKLNEHELAQWWGGALRSEAAIRGAAMALSQITGGWVLVSRGARLSFLFNATEQASYAVQPPRVTVRNTVGAGDALLAAAAWQIELGAPPEQWLRCGVATGSAATQCAAGELPSRSL